jgi:hypothetical protein
MKMLPQFRRTTNLIPFSGVQFLDFGFNIDDVPRLTKVFWEEEDKTKRTPDGEVPINLHCPVPGEEGDDYVLPESGDPVPEDETYQFNLARALEVFLGKWVPVPFFRSRGRDQLGRELHDRGPTNWARCYVTELAERERDGTSHRVVLAFDTGLEDQLEGRPYLAPKPRDSEEEQEFCFVPGEEANSWFLSEPWVDDWLDEMLREFKQAQRPRRPLSADDFPHACEHWARYLTFLAALDSAIEFPRFKLSDTVSQEGNYIPIQVDLVLDIGNSRNCGILIESNPGTFERIDLNNSYALELRDLTQPIRTYDEPFTSTVEFARARFGKDHFSRRSGRANAFYWPTVTRVGPEAAMLSGEALGTEGLSGMSSPKRYLWEDRPLNQAWRFNAAHGQDDQSEAPISGSFMAYVTESGDVLRQLPAGQRQRAAAAVRPKFSRSSLFTFMLSEILLQAIVQINAPANRGMRKNAEAPRQLRRILMTAPPGMPLAEQRLLKLRAEAAVKLTWDCLGWTKSQHKIASEPRIEIICDEASATQLVYLYTEVTQNHQEGAKDLFQIMGKPRGGPDPTLRIASIDIGGGTTDLMVTSYEVEENRAINPRQDFRESFKIAGDDIVKAVLTNEVLPPLQAHMTACGVEHADALVSELFGGNRAGMPEQERHLRQQFVNQLLVPVGLAILAAYEKTTPIENLPAAQRALTDIIPLEDFPAERVLDYVERRAADNNGRDFHVRDLVFEINPARVALAVRSVMSDILSDLCEVVQALDCDLLLLSGRPSRLPAILQMVLARLPVRPNRVISMHQYRVGGWYPFRDAAGRIHDPKSTAAVGAMLCGLAEGQIQNFLFRSSRLFMKSTAKYIGQMEISGKILRDNEIFSDIDLESAPSGAEQVPSVQFYAPMAIGYRQLPLERWPAMPLYYLEFANPASAKRLNLPLSVGLTRATLDEDDEEYKKEDFQIEEIEDAEGTALRKSDVTMRLQTLTDETGYWLDTGILVGR